MTLVGRMKENVKLVTRRKAQKCTGYTIVWSGTKSDGRIPDAFRKWEQKSESLKEGGEMAKRFCDTSYQ